MTEPIEIQRRCNRCITKPCTSCPFGGKQVRDSDKLENMAMALGYTPIERIEN